MTLPPAPPLTPQDAQPAPRQKTTSIFGMLFWKWRWRERLIIGGLLCTVGLIAGGCTVSQQVALSGRAQDAIVRVEAPGDVCWTGLIGNATHDGCGDQDIAVHDDTGFFNSNAMITSGSGTLTISVVVDGAVKVTNSTSADHGLAGVIVPM